MMMCSPQIAPWYDDEITLRFGSAVQLSLTADLVVTIRSVQTVHSGTLLVSKRGDETDGESRMAPISAEGWNHDC